MTALKFWKGANRWYDRIIMLFLVLLLLIVCYCMYDNYWVYSHSIDKSILKYKPGSENYDPDDSPITNEMVAWLTVDNTNIDYPVMQSGDNIKFLNTDPYGSYSLTGSIFLDSRNSPDFTDEYSLVYGHHMEYGKMFGALDDFLDEDYLKSHTSGELMIGREGKKKYKLKVFASASVRADEESVFNVTAGNTKEFINSHAKVRVQEPQGRILALSTCSDGDSVDRVVVFCCLIE
ncbi:MAG: class B sortase [Ruminococcus sp.]|nr:class B sortase [Ruminococcus sp.]MBR6985929.1 class B sortase [Ruminococcus sp.]